MWMDELNPWLIARDAHSLRELFFNMRFEPHPALWYLCLYAVTRVTSNPIAMQILHGVIATASVAVIAYWSPFRRRDVVLLAFSYYFVFEFCAISRGYALGVLLILIACVSAASSRPRPVGIAIALALAANTSAFALIIVMALSIAIAPRVLGAGWRRVTTAALIVVASVVTSAVTLLPSPENVYGSNKHLDWSWVRLDDTIRLASDAVLPFPNVTVRSPWNSNGIESVTRLIPWYGHFIPLVVAASLIAAALIYWRGRLSLRLAFLAGTFAMLILMYVEYSGGYRHHGHLFILLLALMWMHAQTVRAPQWFTVMLAVQVAAGIYFVQADVRRPFSDSRLIARFLEQQPGSIPIVAAQPTILNYEGPQLASYLRRHVFYATSGGIVTGSYLRYDRARSRDASESEIVNEIERFADSIESDVFVVTSHWTPTTLGEPLYAPSEATIEGDERNSAVYLYSRPRKRS